MTQGRGCEGPYAPSRIRTSASPEGERCRRVEAARGRTPRAGFEPAAYSLGGSRSIQLSYRGRAPQTHRHLDAHQAYVVVDENAGDLTSTSSLPR